MSDTVFCTECKWFIRNEKVARVDFDPYDIDERTGAKSPKESYWDCSHQSNIGKKIHWWGIERYYKRKPSQMNEKNDCARFERRKDVSDCDC